MVDRWHDPAFATAWDHGPTVGNPTRLDHLDIVATLVAALAVPDATLLDLGAGSGQVEELLLTRCPTLRIVGVDGSAAMLALAERRLAPFAERCTLLQHDLLAIEQLHPPVPSYPLIISVQTLHHLPHDRQQAVLGWIARHLQPGGYLLLVDRLQIDAEHLAPIYGAMWERAERLTAVKSGWNPEQYRQRLRNKQDHTATLDQQLAWLRAAGLVACCLHLNLDRALFAARKP